MSSWRFVLRDDRRKRIRTTKRASLSGDKQTRVALSKIKLCADLPNILGIMTRSQAFVNKRLKPDNLSDDLLLLLVIYDCFRGVQERPYGLFGPALALTLSV